MRLPHHCLPYYLRFRLLAYCMHVLCFSSILGSASTLPPLPFISAIYFVSICFAFLSFHKDYRHTAHTLDCPLGTECSVDSQPMDVLHSHPHLRLSTASFAGLLRISVSITRHAVTLHRTPSHPRFSLPLMMSYGQTHITSQASPITRPVTDRHVHPPRTSHTPWHGIPPITLFPTAPMPALQPPRFLFHVFSLH